MVDELTGKRVVILGLARQGVAMARFAANVGARVTVSDLRPAAELQDSLTAVSDLTLEIVLGNHPSSLLDNANVIVVSGGVPANLPIVKDAQHRGILVTNDSQEFIKRAPGQVIGITGSAGKTTTTALTGKMIEMSGRTTWVGGNIGRPLLLELPNMKPDDVVVQELSSFQLELWTRSPSIAAILNITPNHLDRHYNFEEYSRAKANILRFQAADDIAVLSKDDPGVQDQSSEVKGRLRTFSQREPVNDGAFVDRNELILRDGNIETVICGIDQIPLRGPHNVYNVLAATVLADSVSVPASVIKEAIVDFQGMPHRLEHVATINNAQYINDSIATAPDRVLAALDSYSEPVILLAGGRDKDMIWEPWASQVQEQAKAVILFGELGELLEMKLAQASSHADRSELKTTRVKTLDEAVLTASQIALPGDIVLLAPGGTSFDSYVDYEDRGKAFRKVVLDLAKEPKVTLSGPNGSG